MIRGILGSLARRRQVLRNERSLDYRRASASVRAPEEPGAADVIVPVHGAHAAFKECLGSLSRHTDWRRHRLRVVIDGDPELTDEAVYGAVDPSARSHLEVLRNDTPKGFVAAVNRGLARAPGDVVLLNSDTVVTSGWLEKMQRAAYSAPGIATVSPFSNHATICSLPLPLRFNPLPPGLTVDEMAQLVEGASQPSYPRLPTGVGMCLYIRGRVLEEVGPLDEGAFSPGYGEETDFCFRALKAGYVHVLDDATFIYHHGEQSFGERRSLLVRSAERTMRRLHPEYRPTIGRFLAEDPLAEARRRVRWSLRSRARPEAQRPAKVLHVVHGWPPFSYGGTELYAQWLVELQQDRRSVAVLARIADPERSLGSVADEGEPGRPIRLLVNNFEQRNPWSRNALGSWVLERQLLRYLDEIRPDLVHIHHLAGLCASLVGVVRRRGLPVVLQLQDWWALCPRVNLMRPERTLCSGPGHGKCSRCFQLTRLPGHPLWNRLLYALRGRVMRRALRQAQAVVMGSRSIEGWYRGAGLLPAGERVYVLPYGVPLPPDGADGSPIPPGRPLRFACVGSVLPHKGLHIAAEAFAEIDPAAAVLDIWGLPDADPGYAEELRGLAGGATLRFRGTFPEGDRERLYQEMDVLLAPSVGLESFGLAAREALARGVPVIAANRGALAELFGCEPSACGWREEGCGTLVAPEDPAALRAVVRRILREPSVLEAWRRRRPEVLGAQEHAEAIEEVYLDVLEREGGQGRRRP